MRAPPYLLPLGLVCVVLVPVNVALAVAAGSWPIAAFSSLAACAAAFAGAYTLNTWRHVR